MTSTQKPTSPAWSARCDCYNSHNSSSGRCNNRDVTDPTATEGQPAKCERCRRECCKPEPTKPVGDQLEANARVHGFQQQVAYYFKQYTEASYTPMTVAAADYEARVRKALAVWFGVEVSK